MTWELARPSFWTEPRDPWAWQRALRRLATMDVVPDPWPCWERHLRDLLPRRAVGGLYGLKTLDGEDHLLGAGLLESNSKGWFVAPQAQEMIDAGRDVFQHELAAWLVRRSAWVRLSLRRLSAGRWVFKESRALHARRALRIGVDLIVDVPAPDLADSTKLAEAPCTAHVEARALSPLHAPLYLLASLGWLDSDGRPHVPESLSVGLVPTSAAGMLRELAAEHADASGFVSLETMARGLWTRLHGRAARGSLAGWIDAVFGSAIASGAIEIHAWAAGQPRHGRGLFGDRDRKLARWTIHDDFTLSAAAISPPEVSP